MNTQTTATISTETLVIGTNVSQEIYDKFLAFNLPNPMIGFVPPTEEEIKSSLEGIELSSDITAQILDIISGTYIDGENGFTMVKTVMKTKRIYDWMIKDEEDKPVIFHKDPENLTVWIKTNTRFVKSMQIMYDICLEKALQQQKVKA